MCVFAAFSSTSERAGTKVPALSLSEIKQGIEQARRSLGCSYSRSEFCGAAASPVYRCHNRVVRTLSGVCGFYIVLYKPALLGLLILPRRFRRDGSVRRLQEKRGYPLKDSLSFLVTIYSLSLKFCLSHFDIPFP